MSGQLLLFADIPLTPHQLAMAARTAKANRQRIEREKYLAAAATEFKAMKRRRDLLHAHLRSGVLRGPSKTLLKPVLSAI